jgi:indole-3-glycerol phosphate synthase
MTTERTHSTQIANLLVRMRRSKRVQTRLRVAMCEICVREFGIDQSKAPQICESFLDGYLVGLGIMQAHRVERIAKENL